MSKTQELLKRKINEMIKAKEKLVEGVL